MLILPVKGSVRLITSTLLLLLACSGSAQTYQGRQLVKAELIADTTAVVPGRPFTVGLLLRMVPHWHTYWKFSGDAGLPTEIKWDQPAGFQIGEIRWPIPLKLKDPGDIETYGYEDEVLLFQIITPPSRLDESHIKLSAEVSWLVCERLCIPGSAKLDLSLPVSASASVANMELFDKYRRLLPQDARSANGTSVQWNETSTDLRLHVTNPSLSKYPVVDFYPLPPADVVLGHPALESRNGSEVLFRIPVESAKNKVTHISGVVVYASQPNAEDRAGWSVGNVSDVAARVSTAAVTRGIWTFLFFGFVGGLILNLMPCVLPVISLKLFGFIQHAGKDRRSIVRNGIAFVLGIFVWFIGLAGLLIALKGAGHQITWAAQFTNPYFVLILSVIVLVFALDLFGVFEITVPQALTSRMLHSATREGEAGSFFQGVFATVLATPCTAPFLGTALGFAFTQSAVVILAMFLAIAAGMSAPYLILSLNPAWIRFLPKPGPWMEHLKQFMGFLLLATLLFLLYVLGAQRGYEGLIWASCFLLVVSIACWIKGRFLTPVANPTARAMALLIILLLVAGGGAYFIGGKFRASKMEMAMSDGDWQRFTPERLKSEIDQGRSVFVDFTAAWCLTCKFNERTVLESAAVRDAFHRHGVTKMKADWTNGDPAITKLLEHFGRPGVPLYVLYPGKAGEPIVFPELLTRNMLLEKLETVGSTFALE